MIRRLIATSIVLGGISVPAVAQSSSPSVEQGIEEVTVTSRRRAEVAQDVPLPISAIDGFKLDNTGTFNVNRLQQLQPSLQFFSSNPRNTAVNIRGETNTMPLHVEILYNEYNFAAAFAVASLLALLALLTLGIKSFLEARHGAELSRARRH
jgi:outer membrane receptor protein involved in Fe transport